MRENIPKYTDILLVGINVSATSEENRALWSSQKGPWNVWTKGEIFKGYSDDLKKAVELCNTPPFTNGFIVGFTDMVDIAETNSNKVKIQGNAREELKRKILENKVKNVVLMGDRVIEKFAAVHPSLEKNWEQMIKNKVPYGSKNKSHPAYGFMGNVKFDDHCVGIYGMPFPTTVPIKDKYKFYKEMIKDLKQKQFQPI